MFRLTVFPNGNTQTDNLSSWSLTSPRIAEETDISLANGYVVIFANSLDDIQAVLSTNNKAFINATEQLQDCGSPMVEKSTPQKLTPELVKNCMLSSHKSIFPIRNCSICDYSLNFFIKDSELFFDSGCDCTAGSTRTKRDWSEIVDFINQQHDASIIKSLYKLFNLG